MLNIYIYIFYLLQHYIYHFLFQVKLVDALDGSGRGAAFVAAVAKRLEGENKS